MESINIRHNQQHFNHALCSQLDGRLHKTNVRCSNLWHCRLTEGISLPAHAVIQILSCTASAQITNGLHAKTPFIDQLYQALLTIFHRISVTNGAQVLRLAHKSQCIKRCLDNDQRITSKVLGKLITTVMFLWNLYSEFNLARIGIQIFFFFFLVNSC